MTLQELGHDFDPDNDRDVEWLWQWAHLAQKRIRELESLDASKSPMTNDEPGPEFNGPLREELGREVRKVWLIWAVNQPDKERHPNWFLSWEQLDERDREVDRMIGAAIYIKAREDASKAGTGRASLPSGRFESSRPVPALKASSSLSLALNASEVERLAGASYQAFMDTTNRNSVRLVACGMNRAYERVLGR